MHLSRQEFNDLADDLGLIKKVQTALRREPYDTRRLEQAYARVDRLLIALRARPDRTEDK